MKTYEAARQMKDIGHGNVTNFAINVTFTSSLVGNYLAEGLGIQLSGVLTETHYSFIGKLEDNGEIIFIFATSVAPDYMKLYAAETIRGNDVSGCHNYFQSHLVPLEADQCAQPFTTVLLTQPFRERKRYREPDILVNQRQQRILFAILHGSLKRLEGCLSPPALSAPNSWVVPFLVIVAISAGSISPKYSRYLQI